MKYADRQRIATDVWLNRYHHSAVPDLPLLINIAVALAYALAGGLLARWIGLPAIVGYLLAGIALGPFTPGFHGDEHAIHQLAELGVMLLMFGIGMHFSFKDLWRVRDIAIPGALLQMGISTLLGYVLMRAFGATTEAAIVVGAAISVASTVVLLRGLMDNGLLDTLHGRVAVGWLVLEDLGTVVLLVLLPLLATAGGDSAWTEPLWTVGKALFFVVLMLTAGPRILPPIMALVVRTGSRELFILVALTAAVGTALAGGTIFGVSLALGAFLAGVLIAESPFSHQVNAELMPFREAFAVLFFVSVGMLVNPIYVVTHWTQVLALSALIIAGKGILTVAMGALFPYPARTLIVVAAGLGQIGEFSFILGQGGLTLGLIDTDQYSLILASALVSITLNPLLFHAIDPVERLLRRSPAIWRTLNWTKEHVEPPREGMTGHVVIVGCGRVGRHIAEALGRLQIPRLVVEADPARLKKLRELGVPVLYGDAGSSEILDHAWLENARALVITLPDDAAALAVAITGRRRASDLRIVARASTWDGAKRLQKAGVNDVVRPELEGGVEIVRRTLLDLDLPVRDVQRYTELIRREGMDETKRPSAEQARVLDHLLGAARNLEVGWIEVEPSSAIAGRTIGESEVRAATGALIVGLARGNDLSTNPAASVVLASGDRLALIGTPEQIQRAEAFIISSSSQPPEPDKNASKSA